MHSALKDGILELLIDLRQMGGHGVAGIVSCSEQAYATLPIHQRGQVGQAPAYLRQKRKCFSLHETIELVCRPRLRTARSSIGFFKKAANVSETLLLKMNKGRLIIGPYFVDNNPAHTVCC